MTDIEIAFMLLLTISPAVMILYILLIMHRKEVQEKNKRIERLMQLAGREPACRREKK